MKEAYEEFSGKVGFLIENLQLQKKHLDSTTAPNEKLLIKKFNHVSYIIFLYGASEEFLRVVVGSYLKDLSNTETKYPKIQKNLQTSHLKYSAELLAQSNRNRHIQSDPATIVKTLYSCLVEKKTSFYLPAFEISSGNLTHNKVTECLRSIGILNPEQTMKELHGSAIHKEALAQATTFKDLYTRVDELYDQRNKIAHNASIKDIDQLDSFEIIEQHIENIREYYLLVMRCLESELGNIKLAVQNSVSPP